MDIPIVVVTYNRPQSLKRLLLSLSNANYQPNRSIDLIISIDYSDDISCAIVARQFNWEFGKKTILEHKHRLGLKEHIIRCGDISLDHDGILLLEDDLIVSPSFYNFAIAASQYYIHNDYIAGISLYGYERNEFCDMPFSPIPDGSDIYFMKVPSSWGEVFLRKHWNDFKKSYIAGIVLDQSDFLPNLVINNWSEASWKKLYFKHMITNNLFFVYPMHSYSSNMGEIGSHYFSDSSFLKTKLSLKKENFIFNDFESTINIYDQFMEWEPSSVKCDQSGLPWDDIEIDLYGYKPLKYIKKSKVVTSRIVTVTLGHIDVSMHPVQLNVYFNNINSTGDLFTFNIANVKDVVDDSFSIRKYFNRCICPNLRLFSFREGIESVKKSFIYKTGYLILWPAKIIFNLFSSINRKLKTK